MNALGARRFFAVHLLSEGYVVRVGMPDTVVTYALHELPVLAPQRWEVTHGMIGWIVDCAAFTST
jgi:hypothetical protein